MLESITKDAIIENVKSYIGGNAWAKLQSETQIGIITAEQCYLSFKYDSYFDFSAAIVQVMKGLELELRRVFYEPYLSYLVSNYSPEQYVAINWKNNPPGDRNVAEKRNKILSFDGGKLHFQTCPSREFTIGNFRYTIGADNRYITHVDETFVQYAMKLYDDFNVQKSDIIRWINYLVPEIEGLRQIRNDSAHAGRVQNVIDAQTVLRELIEVEKIIGKIVAPQFSL